MSRQTRDLKSVHPTWTTWSAVYDWGHWEAQDWEGKARTRTRGTPFIAVTACLPLPTLEPFAEGGGLPFSVPDSPVCRATLLKCPPKGFVRQGFCAHLSGKNVFVEKFKLKLGDSKRTQNQMQIERLQMQMVLFKGLFWQTEELWRKPSGWQVFQRSRARESFTAWRGFPSAGANFLLFKFIPLLQSANHGYSYRGTV